VWLRLFVVDRGSVWGRYGLDGVSIDALTIIKALRYAPEVCVSRPVAPRREALAH